MKFKIEEIIGADDNYVILKVSNNEKSFIVNREQWLEENEEIEKYFNVDDVIEGNLSFELVKSENIKHNELFIEQGIYKFSSFSKIGCRIIKELSSNQYLAKINDNVEIEILSNKNNQLEIGKDYLIEGYIWLM